MMESRVKPALITKVLENSIAAEVGFEAGDQIVAINGEFPRDLIDYNYLCAEEFLLLEVLDQKGKKHTVEIEKDYDDDLGLEFESALFDGLIQCNNRCPFCFIDQQPPGKRETLYLKDDDYRLSFLYGSYLTLTNLTSKEWERIEQMRLSPLYVSVHATEPEIRVRLLKNMRAGMILEQLKWFQERRLQIHAQVVVCPGINDGVHLEKTLRDLAKFHTGKIPAVQSVAVVPVGLTKFRPAQDELVPVTPEKAREVISLVEGLQTELRAKKRRNCIWLADEWFLISGEPLPPASFYEDYPQIGNGVGSIRQFLSQFDDAFNGLEVKQITPKRRVIWVVGNAVEKAFVPIVEKLNSVAGLEVTMMAINSDYWGQAITVTGLLTGQDLLTNLSGKDLGDKIILPSVMLKAGDTLFLDDLRVDEVAEKLGVPVVVVSGVEGLINWCLS